MKLREWLFKKRLSITFFAALMKVDRSYVHRWFSGEKVPSEAIMKKIRELTLNEISTKEDLVDDFEESRHVDLPEDFGKIT